MKFHSQIFQIFCTAFLIIVSASLTVAAQPKIQWFYVTTLPDGGKIFLNREVFQMPNKNLLSWEKIQFPSGMFATQFSQWDCLLRTRRTIQTILYSSNQEVLKSEKVLGSWSNIAPTTGLSFVLRRLCERTPSRMMAVIVSDETSLRKFPFETAEIVRVAMKNQRFAIVPETGGDGWYNIFDTATQEDYWLHNSNFKIVSEKVVLRAYPQIRPSNKTKK